MNRDMSYMKFLRRIGRRSVLICLLALLIVSLLVACGPGSPTGDPTDTIAATETETASGIPSDAESGSVPEPADTSASTVPTTLPATDTPADTASETVSDTGPADSGAETPTTPTGTDASVPEGTEPADPPVESDPPTTETPAEGTDPITPPATDPADPPVLTLAPPKPETEPPLETEPDAPPYDPDNHPGDSSLYEGVMIGAVYGTGKKGADAVISNGYIQLYNREYDSISLAGAALYYKSDSAGPFEQFVFPDDATIPAGGYYLVRANAPTDFVASNAIMSVENFDSEWDIHIDNKEVRLLLAPAGWSILEGEDITRFDDAISVFVATEAYNDSVYAVNDLSRYKVAVRTAKTDYSGYHLVNLTRAATPDLRALRTCTSSGVYNDVVASRLNEVLFSHDAGIYKHAISLTLSAKSGYTIYYTTDGSDPSVSTNRARKTYTGAISLADSSAMPIGPVTDAWQGWGPMVSEQVGGYVIKAYATNGTESTSVYTNTYFITDDLSTFGLSIVSISMPLNEIMGSGFYANFCPTGVITDPRPRGTGIVEVFDTEGKRVGNSRVEMAVSGNGSSGLDMKSLRLYYKSANNRDAGLQSDLNYDIFGGRALDANGQAITSFSRLLLRNSGNDYGNSYFRDAYMQRVSAGLETDIMASATTLVFINGEFWGVYNMRERYSPEYVESHYGVNKDNVAIIENDYLALTAGQNPNAPYVLGTGLPGDEVPFNELLTYMQTHDLSNDENFAYVADRLDLDSLIDMCIARIYFNARDWPENNMKIWRNKDPNDPSGMDTKWHFTLLDMDMGISFYPMYHQHDTSEIQNFVRSFLESGSTAGKMFQRLLANESFRNRFILRGYELLCDYYTEDFLLSELEAMIAERAPVMFLQHNRWCSSDGVWQSDCADMRAFVQNRADYIMSFFLDYFGVSEDDLATLSQKRITVTFNDARVEVDLNGVTVENGHTIKMEPNETRTLQILVTAKEGYIITGITYTDRNGNRQEADAQEIADGEVILTVSESGTVSVTAKRESQDVGKPTSGQLVAGANYLFYLTENGDLYAWGDNRYGVLGLESEREMFPKPMPVMQDVAKVVTSSGNDYENKNIIYTTAILTTDGRVLTVGQNTAGQLGRNGTTASIELAEIEFNGVVVDISLGHDHLLILDENGTVWGVGSNAYGALGKETFGNRTVTTFTRVADGATSISAGRRSTLYTTDNGDLWVLGDNRWDKFSTTAGDTITDPLKLATGIVFMDGGEHQHLAVDEDGQLYYMGWRTVLGFQQGGGNDPAVARFMNGVVKADIYYADMVILTENGDAYVYGLNTDNSIGSAVTGGTPQKFLSGVADVAAGYGFTAYLMEDGRILVQGSNEFGQAGNGTTGGRVSLAEANI